MKLKLADDLSLPLDFATKTAAILAQRRKGKTYTASVIAEEMVAAKQPFVALDPTGAWWGLRASADGKSEGLPVVVLGGQRGDVPLERTGGRLIADLVVDEPGYYVIDFSLFESGDAERQFAVDFAERLYRAKAQPGKDFPLHLFVDEADRFIPQQMRKGSNEMSPRLLGAFEAIVRRGGLRGLGTTLISQRAAVVNKNVLEMLDILITLRTVGPNDREAIAGYIDAHGTDAEREEMMGSLASLDIGEAWVWEPGAEPPLFKRVRIRQRHTFNSSATPKAGGGEKRVEPKRLADVDLAALHTRMAATIEKAKAEDPRELRKQIQALKAELGKKQVESVTKQVVSEKRVEVLTDADRALLRQLDETIVRVQMAGVDEFLAAFRTQFESGAAVLLRDLRNLFESKRLMKLSAKLDAASPEPVYSNVFDRAQATYPLPGRTGKTITTSGWSVSRNGDGDTLLPPGERSALTAVAQYAEGIERSHISILTGYKRSTRDRYLQFLQQKGYVESRGDVIVPTPNGIRALGDFEPLPTGRDLQEYWRRKLPPGEAAIFEVVLRAHPNVVPRERIDEATGFKRSTRDRYLQFLQTRRLVKTDRGGVRASDELF